MGPTRAGWARAAQVVVKHGAALVDINMGCPTPKIVRNREGCALMQNLTRAAEIVEAVAEAVSPVPVTVKMRKGWSTRRTGGAGAGPGGRASGAAAVTVHGRTRDQFYSGPADWGAIRAAQQAVSIPVIGNGDIWVPTDARRMLDETGCEAVMIGRGALGNPWLFTRTVHYLETGQLLPVPSLQERIEQALVHFDLSAALKGRRHGPAADAQAPGVVSERAAWSCPVARMPKLRPHP